MQEGYEKIEIFDQYLALSQKRYKIGLTPNNNVNSYSIYEWYHFE